MSVLGVLLYDNIEIGHSFLMLFYHLVRFGSLMYIP